MNHEIEVPYWFIAVFVVQFILECFFTYIKWKLTQYKIEDEVQKYLQKKRKGFKVIRNDSETE